MYVAFMKCHNPNNPAPEFKGKSKESHYLDALMELDHNSGMIVEAIRELGLDENTIVVWTTDNGPWIDAWPDAGYTPFRAMKGTSFEGGWRVPAIMRWPGHIEAGRVGHGITSHIDLWATLAAMVGLEPPPHGPWQDNNCNPIWYDGVDQDCDGVDSSASDDIWKVRPNPSLARPATDRPETSRPSSHTSPSSCASWPATCATRVDLPAPLGPISA